MSAEAVYAFGRENDFKYVSEDIGEYVIERSSWGPRKCRVSPLRTLFEVLRFALYFGFRRRWQGVEVEMAILVLWTHPFRLGV